MLQMCVLTTLQKQTQNHPESDMSVNFPHLTCEGSSSCPTLMNWREVLFSADKKK